METNCIKPTFSYYIIIKRNIEYRVYPSRAFATHDVAVDLSACGSLCKQQKQAKSSLRMTVRQKGGDMGKWGRGGRLAGGNGR